MSTFAELAAMPGGVGCFYYFDVAPSPSIVNPYTLRYSTVWFSPENYPSNLDSQPRIMALGNLTRALGDNRGMTAATISVTLDNADGGVDWLSDRATYATQAIQSEWRLTCQLYDARNPLGAFGDYDVKVLGIFTLMDPPTRKNETIEFTLVDKTLTKLDINTPTVLDWCGITDASRPFTEAEYRTGLSFGTRFTAAGENMFPLDSPTPVAWGYSPQKPQYIFKNCYIICAVPGSPSGLPITVDQVFAGNGFLIPQTLESPSLAYAGLPMTVWTVRRTPVITKNGKQWHLLWLDFDLTGDGYRVNAATGRGDSSLIWDYLQKQGGIDLSGAAINGTYFVANHQQSYKYLGYNAHQTVNVSVVVRLLSHNVDNLATIGILAATVVEDIFTTCIDSAISVSGASSVNPLRPTSFAANTIDRSFSKTIRGDGSYFKELIGGQTLTAIRQLCELGQFDAFIKWDGTVKIDALGADYNSQTSTLGVLDETLVKSVTEKIPAIGERNGPVNRTFINANGVRYGPFDDAASIASWKRVVARDVDATWMPNESRLSIGSAYAAAPLPLLNQFSYSDLSTIRPVLRVVTGIIGLTYELCDYITFTWRRGTLNGPYIDTIFRVESLTLNPLNGEVEMALLWCGDLRTNLPYILDSEALNVRLAATFSRTMTLTDTSTTVVCSSGNLGTDGVVPGDILIVQDATESTAAFKRNRTLIISGVTATTLTVDQSDFGTGGPFVVTTWEVRRSAATTARAAYFGKTCSLLGKFQSTIDANRLLEG